MFFSLLGNGLFSQPAVRQRAPQSAAPYSPEGEGQYFCQRWESRDNEEQEAAVPACEYAGRSQNKRNGPWKNTCAEQRWCCSEKQSAGWHYCRPNHPLANYRGVILTMVQFTGPVLLPQYGHFQLASLSSWIQGGCGDGNPEQQNRGRRAELARDIITFLSTTARTCDLGMGPANIICSFLASE